MSKNIIFGILSSIVLIVLYYQTKQSETYTILENQPKPVFINLNMENPISNQEEINYIPIQKPKPVDHKNKESTNNHPYSEHSGHSGHSGYSGYSGQKVNIERETPYLTRPKEHLRPRPFEGTNNDLINGEPIQSVVSDSAENYGQQRQRLHQSDTAINLKRFIRQNDQRFGQRF